MYRTLATLRQFVANYLMIILQNEICIGNYLFPFLGYPHWQALYDALQHHRSVVSEEFDRLLAPRERSAKASALERYWRALPDAGEVEVLADAGFADAAGADAALRQFAASPALRSLSSRGRTRLDQVVPALLHATGASSEPHTALQIVRAHV